MGKVKYATGIDYVQGSLAKPKVKEGHTCGTYLIGTHRTAATTNPNCTSLYVREADTYKRTSQPSSKELAARARFTAVSAAIKVRKADLMSVANDEAAFIAQKNLPGGKKTLKAWYWMVCGNEYDQEHGN